VDRLQLIVTLLHLIRRWQRENSAIDLIFNSGCNMAEIILMIEIDSFPDYHAKALASNLGSDVSNISKAIKKLILKGLLLSQDNLKDRRFKILKISKKGLKVVKDADLKLNAVLERLSFGLAESEIGDLASYLQTLCDQFNVAQSQLRSSDHILRPVQRRLARLIGANQSCIHGTNLSILNWQILSELKESDFPLRNLDLSERLKIDPARISFLIKDLCDKNLLKKESSEVGQYFILTDRGDKFLNEQEIAAAQFIDLHSNQKPLPQDGLELFERFIKDRGYGETRLNDNSTLKRISAIEEKNILRGQVISDLVAQNKQHKAPGSILGPNDFVFVHKSLNGTVSTIQFEKSEDSFRLNLLVGDLSRDCLELCFREVIRRYPGMKVIE
jgi:DNA-binding MarR family transcriptional regulator